MDKQNKTFTLKSEMQLNSVKLWWPNSLSHQHTTYQVTVFEKGSREKAECSLGFRQVELVRENDKEGEGQSFYFQINNVPTFCKGASWIPGDNLDSRFSDEKMRSILESASASNFSCIRFVSVKLTKFRLFILHIKILRVWGGGIYERDYFYQICDDLGLTVFHDLMFACSLYPCDEEFLENVRQEVCQQVSRISLHPCVIVWCGNNECEEAIDLFPLSKSNREKYFEEYSKLFEEKVPLWVLQHSPAIPFWPSSPSSGIPRSKDKRIHAQDFSVGDQHYWGSFYATF